MALTIQTGETSAGAVRNVWLERLGWGRCFVERPIRPIGAEPFFVDNGAFRAFKVGELLNLNAFAGRVDRAAWAEGFGSPSYLAPDFAVLPDVVANGAASLELSRWCLEEERRATEDELPEWWAWFLAVQDGMAIEDVRDLLEDNHADDWADRYQVQIAGLFIGGTASFKDETAAAWTELAHSFGLRCHYGRASGLGGLRKAIAAGVDSCDSAAILFSDMKFFRYAQVWLEESVEDPEPELVAWVAQNVERARLEERDRRQLRRAA